MHKIIFIVPYYGKLPLSFREWVYTASFLSEQGIDFLFVSDLEISFELPKNFRLFKASFEDIKVRFQKNFSFEICLQTPYKFCDFRPAYGEIFADLLKGYDFWGHCDVDMLWGDVKSFITDSILEKYDKIQYMGHFVLYRNCDLMNSLYKLDGGIYDYKKVYSSPEFFSYDEHPGIMSIIIKHPVKIYISTNQADLSPQYKRVYVSRKQNYNHQIIYWNNGKILRTYLDEAGNIGTDEFMYVHFQQKKPKGLLWKDNDPKAFMLNSSEMKRIELNKIDESFIKSHDDFICHKEDQKDKRNYFNAKIKKFVSISIKEKIIWVKIRKATKQVNNVFAEYIYQGD